MSALTRAYQVKGKSAKADFQAALPGWPGNTDDSTEPFGSELRIVEMLAEVILSARFDESRRVLAPPASTRVERRGGRRASGPCYLLPFSIIRVRLLCR